LIARAAAATRRPRDPFAAGYWAGDVAGTPRPRASRLGTPTSAATCGKFREVGERLLVRALVTARGQGSSVELTADAGIVFEFREQWIMRMSSYLNRHDAIEAVGLRE
jgi:hypothetical protein